MRLKKKKKKLSKSPVFLTVTLLKRTKTIVPVPFKLHPVKPWDLIIIVMVISKSSCYKL